MVIRMESTMARVTGAAATAIVRRRTATTNTPTVATAQATATKITTNKPTARRMKADIARATSVAVPGAGTNSTVNEQKPCGESHGFYFFG
jgi:topoisomerase IA-like protein